MRSFERCNEKAVGRDPEPQARVRSRLRRSRLWLTTARIVHGSTFVFVALALGYGSVPGVGAAAIAGALAVGPVIVLLWWERRAPSRERPAIWPRRGLAIVVPHAAAFGIAAAGTSEPASLPWMQVLGFACGLLLIEGGAICEASRALRFPLTPELGGMDVEVLARIRSLAGRRPAWLSHDDVRMTTDDLIITVRPSPAVGYAIRIGLPDVTEVVVHPTTVREAPWLVVDGHEFWLPGGDVVLIKHRSGTVLLPVHEPGAFADVLCSRIQMLGRMRPAE